MEKKNINKRTQRILFWVVLLLGIFLRIFLFSDHPGGLNQDEASTGYDAWSILNYGVDRNGTFMPVHHISWGSGQNALYTYLSIPFIAIFGLNTFSIRCVNLVCSILSILAIYSIAKKLVNFKTAICAMALFAISPWNIMLARWGLESNLFPSIFIISLWAMVMAFDREYFLILSAFLFGITLYSYGASYAVVPLFFFASLIYIFKKRLVSLRVCIMALGIFILVAIPIGLFVLVNVFDLDDIRLGFITIPKMTGIARISTVTGNTSLLNAFKNFYKQVILQYDGLPWNSLVFYGCIYVVSLPFTIYGFVIAVKRKDSFSFFALAGFFSSVLLFFIYSETNINRVNVIYVSLIMFTALGIAEIINNMKSILAISITYCIMLIGFCQNYFGASYKDYISENFFSSFGDAILKANEVAKSGDKIYVTNNVNMPYIYVLFYTKPAPYEYFDTVEFYDETAEFQHVMSFGRYVFNISGLSSREEGIYIIPNKINLSEDTYNEIYRFERFSVVVIR